MEKEFDTAISDLAHVLRRWEEALDAGRDLGDGRDIQVLRAGIATMIVALAERMSEPPSPDV